MRPGDPRDMLDVADWNDGYRAGFDDANETRGGVRLASCIVLLAALAIISAVSFAAGRVTAAASRPGSDHLPGGTGIVSAANSLEAVDELTDRGRTGAPPKDSGALTSPSPTTGMRPASAKAPLPALVRSGIASFYDDGPGFYAALPGPWRAGRWVAVCGFEDSTARCETAPVITSCLCRGDGEPKIIDLSPALMERIAGWTAAERRLYGVVRVTVQVLE
jgi:hypothetical protein